MLLTPLLPTDTRFLFRPVARDLVALLRRLAADEWQRPTIAGTWVVRDIVAHLTDLTFRRLSFHRDGLVPPPPPREIRSERDFVEFINWLNREWIEATRRLSPRVLTDLFDKASGDLADFFEALPADAPALFGVSWAGEQESAGWFDVGREFTELWHHQEQIRLAVGAPSLGDPRFLRAVIEIAIRGLPHAYRHVPAREGESLALDISGPAGGAWTLSRGRDAWEILDGAPDAPTTRLRTSDESAWRVWFNALRGDEAASAVDVSGRPELAAPFLNARSIVV